MQQQKSDEAQVSYTPPVYPLEMQTPAGPFSAISRCQRPEPCARCSRSRIQRRRVCSAEDTQVRGWCWLRVISCYIILYYIIFHFLISYYIILYYVVLCCIVLYHLILSYMRLGGRRVGVGLPGKLRRGPCSVVVATSQTGSQKTRSKA